MKDCLLFIQFSLSLSLFFNAQEYSWSSPPILYVFFSFLFKSLCVSIIFCRFFQPYKKKSDLFPVFNRLTE